MIHRHVYSSDHPADKAEKRLNNSHIYHQTKHDLKNRGIDGDFHPTIPPF